jgi:hypothetical protein
LPSPSGVDRSSRLVWFSLVFSALPAELQVLAGRSPVLQFGPFRARLQDFFKLQTAMNDKGRSHQQPKRSVLRRSNSVPTQLIPRRASEITDVLEMVAPGKLREFAISAKLAIASFIVHYLGRQARGRFLGPIGRDGRFTARLESIRKPGHLTSRSWHTRYCKNSPYVHNTAGDRRRAGTQIFISSSAVANNIVESRKAQNVAIRRDGCNYRIVFPGEKESSDSKTLGSSLWY